MPASERRAPPKGSATAAAEELELRTHAGCDMQHLGVLEEPQERLRQSDLVTASCEPLHDPPLPGEILRTSIDVTLGLGELIEEPRAIHS